MTGALANPDERAAIVGEMGMYTEFHDDGIRGDALVLIEACVPGTDVLRTSVLATWTDVLTGLLSARAISPRIPTTIDLEVQLHRPVRAGAEIRSSAEVIKAGRSIVVSRAEFHEVGVSGPVAVAFASFTASPNPDHQQTAGFTASRGPRRRLMMPLAERARCEVIERGVAQLPRQDGGLNAVGGIQGGLIGLVAEAAASSNLPTPVVLTTFNMRYLRPFRAGPARAVAADFGDLQIVEISDAGAQKLGAICTARTAVI